MIALLPIPHLIVTYLLIDRACWRIIQKVRNTHVHVQFFYSFKAELLGTCVTHSLFWWGGFYNEFNIPQIVLISVSTFQLIKNLIRNLKKKEDSFDISFSVFNFMFIIVLLYLGHFYDKMFSLF
jgi:hypothetical protein